MQIVTLTDSEITNIDAALEMAGTEKILARLILHHREQVRLWRDHGGFDQKGVNAYRHWRAEKALNNALKRIAKINLRTWGGRR